MNSYSILLDGRIDNCAEISKMLGVDHVSPANLLLQSYLRWRDDFPKYVRGDYAFAVWDERQNRLLLGRDPSGFRVLYHALRGSQFAFASEARALLALPGFRVVPDEQKVAAWLAFVGNRNALTFFQGISAVPPGNTVLFERGRVTIRSFWDPRNIKLLRLKDPREYDDGLRCVLRQAVRDRITAGEKIGSHLSGGLDSSSVTATAASLLAEQGALLTAFTAIPAVEFDDSLFPRRFGDERPHAAAVARHHPNIDHVLVSNHAERMFPALDRMSSATECPVLNPMNAIWIEAINQQARKRGLDVLLEGGLGNSTISYDGIRALPTLLREGRLSAAVKLAHDLHRGGLQTSSLARQALRPFLPGFLKNRIQRPFGNTSHMAADATGARREFLSEHGHRPGDFPVIERILDGREYRMSMMAGTDRGSYIAATERLYGIQQSDPTGDQRVVEFCLSVPEEQFCRGGIPKSLVRDAMADQIPEAVLKERRKGMQASDFFSHLTAEKDEIVKELNRMQQIDLLNRAMDIPALRAQVAHWPERPANRQEWNDYCLRITRAISIGRFVRRMEDGTLFAPQELPREVPNTSI